MQANILSRLQPSVIRVSRVIGVPGMQSSAARFMSTTHEADLVVIGAGPGGYVAAIKASQLGLKVNY